MGHKYIWQQPEWPALKWQSDKLLELLGRARKAQGKIIAQADFIGLEEQAKILVEEAFTTSAIEGEKLDRNSIRSSVARRLGLPTAGLPPSQRNIDGLVNMLTDAVSGNEKPLNEKRLFGWHTALFPTGYSDLEEIAVGKWRKGKEPMQVVSGPMGKRKVHYEAPPSTQMNSQIKGLLKWWNNPPPLDGIIRAGLAHFWFVTIHPFEDGNGRIARALTDMALAQDEKTGRRLYSLSSQISKERDDYYDVLEKSQKDTCDVTRWLEWFLEMFIRAIDNSQDIVSKAMMIARFWQTHTQADLNERQLKVVNRLLEAGRDGFEGGMTNRKYVSLNKVSREIAKRDLADLEKRGILQRNDGGGRSISYSLKW
ncbi:MAG: Fic family protein [Oligoflexia bacterium]|nr:Fic family protein [Oligoflexia bacterium]